MDTFYYGKHEHKILVISLKSLMIHNKQLVDIKLQNESLKAI